MNERDLDRFHSVLERSLAGEPLSADDQRYLEMCLETSPLCAREHAVLTELADLEAAPDASSRALVDGVMGILAAEKQAAEAQAVAQPGTDAGLGMPRADAALGRRSFRPLRTTGLVRWVAVAASMVLAVAVGRWVAERDGTESGRASHDAAQPTLPLRPRMELVYASGAAHIDGRPVTAGGVLVDPARTVSTAEGTACFVLDPGIDLCLAPHSTLRATQLSGPDRLLTLDAGKVNLRLDKQPPGTSLSIEADGIRSTAVGTAFSVRADAGEVTTTVMEGRVRVHDAARAMVVGAHERIRLPPSGTAERSTLSRAQESAEWGALLARDLWQSEVAGELQVQGEPVGAAVWLDGRAVGALPLSSLVPVGTHVLVVRDGTRIIEDREVEIHAGQRRAVAVVAPAVSPEPTVVPANEQAPAAPDKRRRVRTPTELLSGARHMMVEGRWEDAASIYRALRRQHPRSAEAHTVLVSLAQLELDRLGRPVKALSLLDRYLSGGGGVLSEEARHTRIRALRRLDMPDAEADAIALFLSAHPRSFHARQLGRRLQQLRPSDP